MNITKNILLITVIFMSQINIKADTWDEPWQKEIIQNSEYFVLATVIEEDEHEGIKINVIKKFGSQEIGDTILINSLSNLNLLSSSGHGTHLHFPEGQTLYFFLKKDKNGDFSIPTPSSGSALLAPDKNVYATYRHSYHQAVIPQEVYEKTYTEIWDYYKTSNYDKESILEFINEYIEKSPAGFDENEVDTFFLQHAALETAYLLDIQIELEKLEKFLNSDNFHHRVSSLQLLGNSNKENVKKYLYDYVANSKNSTFEQVIAIWALERIGDKKYIDKLISIVDELSEEETGFGGNIMDPRIGTYFPTPRAAVEDIMNK